MTAIVIRTIRLNKNRPVNPSANDFFKLNFLSMVSTTILVGPNPRKAKIPSINASEVNPLRSYSEYIIVVIAAYETIVIR